MAPRQTLQREIQFGTWVNASGYEWNMALGRENQALVLMPAGLVTEVKPGTCVVSGGVEHKQRLGLSVAHEAYNTFRARALEITASDPTPSVSMDELDGWASEGRAWSNWGLSRLTDDECRVLLADYANDFGTLWGDDDARPLSDWRKEASDFLDLYDVAHALRKADFREFDRRIIGMSPHSNEIKYATHRLSSREMTIAREGEVMESRSAQNALPTTTDYFERAKKGSSRERARMLLSRQVNRKLAGGLSLRTSLLTDAKSFIAPHQLVHLLYARMWLSTVNAEEIERQTTCLNCGREMNGTKRKKYCDDICRTEFHNRRRWAS
jgi:hypothetical protein